MNNIQTYSRSCLYGTIRGIHPYVGEYELSQLYNSKRDAIMEHIDKLYYDVAKDGNKCPSTMECSDDIKCCDAIRYRRFFIYKNLYKVSRDKDYTVIDISDLSCIRNLSLQYVDLRDNNRDVAQIVVDGVLIHTFRVIDTINTCGHGDMKITDDTYTPQEIFIRLLDPLYIIYDKLSTANIHLNFSCILDEIKKDKKTEGEVADADEDDEDDE
jgi:hypothetical protein